MFKCLNCGITRADEADNCWNCGADRYGRISQKPEKRLAQRDILRELQSEKFKCPHGIMRLNRCDKCGRDEPDVLAGYRTSTQKHIEGLLMESGYVKTKAEAAIVAKALIEKLDLREAF